MEVEKNSSPSSKKEKSKDKKKDKKKKHSSPVAAEKVTDKKRKHGSPVDGEKVSHKKVKRDHHTEPEKQPAVTPLQQQQPPKQKELPMGLHESGMHSTDSADLFLPCRSPSPLCFSHQSELDQEVGGGRHQDLVPHSGTLHDTSRLLCSLLASGVRSHFRWKGFNRKRYRCTLLTFLMSSSNWNRKNPLLHAAYY